MTKPKLTEWFPNAVKPVRNGNYEVREPGWGPPVMRRWAGCWLCDGMAITVVSAFNNDKTEWRGLASDPKAAA